MTARRLNIGLASGLIFAVLLSLTIGKVWVPLSGWLGNDPRWLIIAELRGPRTLLAVVIGAGLGVSGAAMQGFLRNPLADPGLFGVSAGAALGAVLSLYFGFAATALLLPAFALVGAALSMTLLALLAGQSGNQLLFALAGMILSSVAGSLTALAISLAPTPFAVTEIVTWLMGALTDRSWNDVQIALPLTVLGCSVLAMTARSLDALTLGEAAARSMGVDVVRLQWMIVVGVGLCVGAGVASAGVIGFVGLMVPHMVRRVVGGRPSATLLSSALGGALLLLLADTMVRAIPTVSELRLGITMSMLGGPFFLWLLMSLRRSLP
ncbi:iron ABC transporter permease [Novosphingobium sp. Chol11]|uniref:FecCD family ABC transporter permease n=1 Tax=Novosphingobium sp. Chol11 TaxID=1385763 RepID=UPI0025E74329|nr:iron ABC transporter permease [Novosphingobium sp. Chol11]